jgi:hypothetical protein
VQKWPVLTPAFPMTCTSKQLDPGKDWSLRLLSKNCDFLFLSFSLSKSNSVQNNKHSSMADEQVPVYYEDLALLETQFDEADRDICMFLPIHVMYIPAERNLTLIK